MNKADVSGRVAARLGLRKAEAEEAVDTVSEATDGPFTEAVAETGELTPRFEGRDVPYGFGSGWKYKRCCVRTDRWIGDDGMAAPKCSRASRQSGIRGNRCLQPENEPSKNGGTVQRYGGR